MMFTSGQTYGCLHCQKRFYRLRSAPAIRSICEQTGRKVWMWRISWSPRWW